MELNEMIKNNAEENDVNVVEMNPEETSAGAGVLAVGAIIAAGVAAVGAAAYGVVWLAGKAKKAWNKRKEAKELKEAEYVEISEEQVEVED